MRLELSEAADRDLDEILIYSTERFGWVTAEDYVRSFATPFSLLERHPQAGPSVRKSPTEIRRLKHRRHRIFYEILRDHVRILRILHEAQSTDGRV